MQSVCVCHGCGRTIDTEFLYCPWCGAARIRNAEPEALEPVFTRLEQLQQRGRVKKLKQLDDILAELEKDLTTLVLSVEMHK
ncbi:hypothetical protein [Treponema brennaborense]|uniref:hypothetical protein n=1 Tax=Treponema brennaborense TaxID=81028 RepID=UPI00031906FF|nr:hypothetical protein [Treponema brennaborense]